MTIGIDGNEANVQKRVGVSTYTLNLLHYFKNRSSKDLQFKIYLRKQQLDDMPEETEYYKYSIIQGQFLWSQIFLPLALNMKRDIDVFFSPAHYAPRFCPCPFIVTIHDLSYFYFPDEFLKKDLYQLKNWTKYSVEKAKKIIAVSKTTKKDLMKIYNIPDEKIEVIYNGFEKLDSSLKIKNWKFIENWKLKIENYILYVGTLQPRKNISTLIKAFNIFKKTNQEYKLVITGRKGWLYEEIFSQVKQLGLEKEVIFTDFVTDSELAELYKHAFCFVMPSFYEGFGIPILEAMSFNCPVISSFASSLPEVGGEACLYFDPQNVNDLLEKLFALKESNDIKKELIKKGKERIKQFSWKTCAEKTLELLIKL